MQNRRKTISLNIKKEISLSTKKLKRPITKIFPDSATKKPNIIRLNSNLSDFSKKKTQSIIINNENLPLPKLKSQNTKERNNIRRSLFFLPVKKEKKKKNIEDIYKNNIKNKIYDKISRKYVSPYILDFIGKKNITQIKSIGFSSYYNYYLISNLINNKKFKFSLDYYEYLSLNNNNEYLIKYFAKNQIYIMMNYLLYIVYGNDIATKSNKSKKILTNEEIKLMFNNLVNNNYNFSGSIEIVKGVGVYYKQKGDNHQNINILSNLDKVMPINNKKIIYKYIKDIPSSKLSNCIPNYYKFEKQVINYMKDFIHKRRFVKIHKLYYNNQFREIKQRKELRYNTNKNKNIKKENILKNISFTLSKDNLNYEENKEKDIDKRHTQRKKIDHETNDIETFLKKMDELIHAKNYINKNKENLTGKRNKRIKSMTNIPFNLIKNKKNIFLSSKRKDNKVLKKEIFLTKLLKFSLKNRGENNPKNINNYNKNNSGKNIIPNNEKNKFQRLENILSQKNEEVKRSRNNLIKFNGFTNNTNNNKGILNQNNSNDIKNNNSIKEISSDDSLFFYKINNISKLVSRQNKHKFKIKTFISLKKLNSFSKKTIAKPKKYVYQGGERKPFSSYSSVSLENKEINVWENNKIDNDIMNVAAKSSYLLNKIGDINKKEIKSFYNCNTLQKLIKYPMIYSSNYN